MLKIKRHNVGSHVLPLFLRLGPVTFRNDEKFSTPLDSERYTAGVLVDRLGIAGNELDKFILVNSLPKAHHSMLSFSLLHEHRVNAAQVFEIGSNCAAILDALHHCFVTNDGESTTVLMLADSFRTSFNASSQGLAWHDGGAAVIFQISGGIKLSLLSFVTGTDTQYLGQVHDLGFEIPDNFSPKRDARFSENDLKNEILVIRLALTTAGLSEIDIDAVVLTNRSKKRISEISRYFPESCKKYSSLEDFGHCGGADVLENLRISLIEDTTKGLRKILLVGNGLGYVWNAMVIECDVKYKN